MRRLFLLVLMLAIAVPGFAQLQAPAAGPDNTPKIGEMAPDFAIPAAQRGAPPSSLKDLQGKKRVLVMFFPGAFTPGCTTEFTEAGVHHDKFVAMNVELIGISGDLQGALNAFKTSVGAKNTFVSDFSGEIAAKYGAANNRGSANRYYFLIDEAGKIVWKNTTNSLLPTEKLLADLGTALKAE